MSCCHPFLTDVLPAVSTLNSNINLIYLENPDFNSIENDGFIVFDKGATNVPDGVTSGFAIQKSTYFSNHTYLMRFQVLIASNGHMYTRVCWYNAWKDWVER